MKSELAEILALYEGKKGVLIPVLQQVQEKLGYISEEAVSQIARTLKLSDSDIFGVASFYTQFRFVKPGEHTVKICLGTACHVRGGEQILNTVKSYLSIDTGETTKDGKFSLERVACLGCCALSPVIVVDEVVHSKMSPLKTADLLSSYYQGGGDEV
jgi:NADH-quinone oxidoreductase subunit E